ncbi:MAG TPA: DUF2171 domain-containing protein [Ktedonobacteraceae bacterium]
MANWTKNDIHEHMAVYDSANTKVGQVEEVYDDSFLVRKGLLFHRDRYIPYAAIAALKENQIALTMSKDEINDKEWNVRPDYEEHLGDPTQLMYDRGHGVQDPFDPEASDRKQ